MKKSEAARFFRKLSLFLTPILLLALSYEYLELFRLPEDYFNFRAWEVLLVENLQAFLPGPLYPERYIKRTEEGDLGHGTKWATRWEAEWKTDPYGFRNDNPDDSPDIVMVGDSFIAGVGLTQADTLSAQVAALSHLRVYSYAPADIRQFLVDERFIRHPPKAVLFSTVERNFDSIHPLGADREKKGLFSPLLQGIRRWQGGQDFFVLLDRASKFSGLNYFYSNYLTRPRASVEAFSSIPILFLQGDSVPRKLSDAETSRLVGILLGYQDALSRRGIDMIFMPIPNKESVYHQFLFDPTEPRLIPQLAEACRKARIKTLELQTPFEKFTLTKRKLLYTRDDTHWNRLGVQIAADLVARTLKEKPQ